MNRHIAAIVFVVLIPMALVSACTKRGVEDDPLPQGSAGSPSRHEPVTTTILCKVNSDVERCPRPDANASGRYPYWHVTKLGPVRDRVTGARVADTFWCTYEYIPTATAEQYFKIATKVSPDVLVNNVTGFGVDKPNYIRCQQDKSLVIPLATVGVHEKMQAGFLQQVGVKSTCPATGSAAAADSPVLVLLPDSLPSNPQGTKKIASSEHKDHGASVAALIREFGGEVTVEGELACAAEVMTALALNKKLVFDREHRVPGRPAPSTLVEVATNGKVGTQSSLAAAIQEARRAWNKEPYSSKKRILNLSVGWEPDSDDGANDFHPVRDAILDAIDDGALVIAAAGNRLSLKQGVYNGLMFPAAYASESYPCVPGAAGQPPEMTCPLVVPVGGIDRNGHFLLASRHNGIPQLVAPAQNASGKADYLADFATNSQPLSSLTGTSVAAAVLSATAARVWAQNPELEPHQVIEKIWNAGRSPEAQSNWIEITDSLIKPPVCHSAPYAFCDKTSPRIVSMCHADGTQVNTTLPCFGPSLPVSMHENLPKKNNHVWAEKTDYKMPSTVFQACGDNYVYRHGDGVAEPTEGEHVCPEKSLAGPMLSGLVGPQPGGCGCDDCRIVAQGNDLYTLYYYIRGDDCPANLLNPRLVLSHTETQATVSIGLGFSPLVQGEQRSVSDISISDYGSYNRAALVATTDPVTEETYAFVWQIVQ